jgi:hypothetical protein
MKLLYSPDMKSTAIPGSGVTLASQVFISDEPREEFMNINDLSIRENSTFSYPVFVPAGSDSKKVILLLHGLNERSWQKYLSWALYLSSQTGSYVILFPISFHITRSPSSWKDPRAMGSFLERRNAEKVNVMQSSFANVALSSRLTEDPMRFFFSGYRTAADICKLLETIKAGKHELIPQTGIIDIFSYSIGSFLSEILMLANPAGLLTESKLFMFCGGSVFSRMNGTSKLIMDNIAFNRLYGFYLKDFERSLNRKNPLFEFLNESKLGLAFRSMIDTSRLRSFREKFLKNIREQISAISLLKDRVIPPAGISETIDVFSIGRKLEVIDPQYDYSHENPFPVFSNEISLKVDDCFKRVMGMAGEFVT